MIYYITFTLMTNTSCENNPEFCPNYSHSVTIQSPTVTSIVMVNPRFCLKCLIGF